MMPIPDPSCFAAGELALLPGRLGICQFSDSETYPSSSTIMKLLGINPSVILLSETSSSASSSDFIFTSESDVVEYSS